MYVCVVCVLCVCVHVCVCVVVFMQMCMRRLVFKFCFLWNTVIISSFFFILCAMNNVYNTSVGKYH